jgi:hypothetical protein
MIILLYISFLIYPFFSGWKDAVLWSKQGDDAYSWDEHLIFTGERVGFGIAVTTACLVDMELHIFVVVGLCSIASFFFFHNGMYYLGRKWIDASYLNFFADTKGNKTFMNVPVWVRVPLFLASLSIILCYEYYF